ncbi:PqqD family protein [Haloimpatiens sp. FM7330]|uniref:PqqD family protein n=1 Tax=Haloimpatiens sp. FM7330 TaxID=3298610 RepID=UPI003638AF12
MKSRKKNALFMVPKRNFKIDWQKNNNIITLKIKRDKTIDKIMHKIFKTPRIVNIELDEIGSFIWENCDGNKNLQDLSQELHVCFGKKVEPVLERLITYIRTLKNNNFIELN